MSLTEPVITWNLFLTAVLVPSTMALGIWYIQHIITRHEKAKDAKKQEDDEQVEKLLKEKEVLKANEVATWRKQICEKLDEVKDCVDILAERVNIANGRTYTLEKDMAIHQSRCYSNHDNTYTHTRKTDIDTPLV